VFTEEKSAKIGESTWICYEEYHAIIKLACFHYCHYHLS